MKSDRSIFELDFYPKDCLHCPLRRVIYIKDKHYQLCCLDYKHGYNAETFFKDEDLKEEWKSEHCPLVKRECIYKSEKNCKLSSCHCNHNGICQNKEKRKECVWVSKAVLCLEDRENERE